MIRHRISFPNGPVSIPVFIHRLRLAFHEENPENPENEHTYYRYVVSIDGDVEAAIEKFESGGIQCRRPVFRTLDAIMGDDHCPNSRRAWNKAISLPIYPALTEEMQHRIIAAAKRIFED